MADDGKAKQVKVDRADGPSRAPEEKSADPVETAFAEFREAWISGKRPDPESFCRRRPECGARLRKKIEDFMFVAAIFPSALRDEQDMEAPRILGDFRIIREIGKGGMGTVYEGEQVSLKRTVALKVLPPHLNFSSDAVIKFRREAEAGGRNSHPGIVTIHAVGEHKGVHYIAQEFIEGGRTLADMLRGISEQGAPPQGYFRNVATLIEKTAHALQHAHDTGVIHRDVKPSNILLTRDDDPKLTDFGLAKVEDALALSRTGDFQGTPYYMSPEQAMSRRMGIDKRTDIYSLGVTLYELLTLKLPFEGDTSHEVLKKVILVNPPDPHKLNPRVPRDLSVICLKAMEKPPERRYQSMQEFADDLHRYLSGDVILARPAGLAAQAWRRIRSHPMISAVAGTALLAALVMALFMLPGKDDRADIIRAQIDLLEELMEGGSLMKTGEQDFEALKRNIEEQIEALKESIR